LSRGKGWGPGAARRRLTLPGGVDPLRGGGPTAVPRGGPRAPGGGTSALGARRRWGVGEEGTGEVARPRACVTAPSIDPTHPTVVPAGASGAAGRFHEGCRGGEGSPCLPTAPPRVAAAGPARDAGCRPPTARLETRTKEPSVRASRRSGSGHWLEDGSKRRSQGHRCCKAETRDQVVAVRRLPSAGADGNGLSEVTRRRYRWFSLGSVSGAVRREP